jgi:Zn-finger nucleic acid-binding protein
MSKVNKTKNCEHCGKDINMRYRKCPVCGGQQQENFEFLPPECPRCNTALVLHVVDGEEYDICPKCSGMWLDRHEFHSATREQNVYNTCNAKGEYHQPPLHAPDGYIPCVRCGKLMNRRNFGKISGIIIDKCSRHGVWLDAGELEKIQHFIADGGLERAQDREIQRNRADLKELASTVDQNTFTLKLIHFWNLKRLLFRGFR